MNYRQAKNRSGGSSHHLTVEGTDGTFAQHHAGAAKRFRRTEDGAQVAGVLQSGEHDDGPDVEAFQQVIDGKVLEPHQGGDALGRFTGYDAIE